MNFSPKNILVIDFGQLGDVVLSLPALKAIREKFPAAKITVAVGKSCAQIIELSGFADEQIVVDRVKLRDSSKLWSIRQIGKLARDVRRRRFDFVIDLHSLAETNILAYLSGARHRLLSRRENRSLDFLARFSPPPPLENRAKHATDRYLDVLQPLGVSNTPRTVRLTPAQKDLNFIDNLWNKHNLDKTSVIGLFPGAGHESRRWKLENFAALAELLIRREQVTVAAFLGPEERELTPHLKKLFPIETIVWSELTLTQLVAALSRLSLFISNDTGPMHLAAAAGTSVVLLLDKNAQQTYVPLIANLEVVRDWEISGLPTENVFRAAQKLLHAAATINFKAEK